MKTNNILNLRFLTISLLLLLLLLCMPSQVFAETRDIYVGDIIKLEITAQNFSEDELREKFSDFEIIEITESKDNPGGYAISMRTFDTGEKIINLGDKEIIINVSSALANIDREDIFEGDSRVIEPEFIFLFHWRIIFCVAAGIFVLSGGFILLKIMIKKKSKSQSPYQEFIVKSEALLIDSDNYFVYLTLCFKQYLESLYKCRIIGKTSSEIVNEIKELQVLETLLSEIQVWLTECDRMKFTGIAVSAERKQEHYGVLLDLVTRIDKADKTDKIDKIEKIDKTGKFNKVDKVERFDTLKEGVDKIT